MPSGKKKKVCLCSQCRELTHLVNGVEYPGVELDARMWKVHATNDILRQSQADYELNTVLLAQEQFGQEPLNRHESLPTRPRDLLPAERATIFQPLRPMTGESAHSWVCTLLCKITRPSEILMSQVGSQDSPCEHADVPMAHEAASPAPASRSDKDIEMSDLPYVEDYVRGCLYWC